MSRPDDRSSIDEVIAGFAGTSPRPVTRIVGVGGTGKTTVLGRIASSAAAARRQVVRGAGSPGASSVAYGGLDPVLGRPRAVSLAAEDDERSSTRSALDALWQALDEAAATVLLVDDAHWLDARSLALLAGAVERASEHGVSVVITHRPAPPSSALAALIAASGRVAAPVVLPLLDAAGVRDIVGQDAGDDRIEALARDSGGIARWAALAAAGEPIDHPVDAELALLGPAARSVLCALAVVGPADLADLAAVAGTADDDAAAALARLRAAGLVERDADRAIALVATALSASTAPPEQARMHLRLAERQRVRGSPASVQAVHLAAATAAGPEAAAVFEAAGDLSLTDAPDEARTWYEHAVRAGADPPGLAARRALAGARAGRPTEALAFAESVLRGGTAADTSRALLAEASALAQLGWWNRSAARYEQAAADALPDEAARLHACRVPALLAAGDVDGAAAALRASESVLPDAHPLGTDVAVAVARGLLACVAGAVRQGVGLLSEAAELGAACRPPDLPIQPAMLAAAVAAHLGDYGVVDRLDPVGLMGAWADLRRGRWRDAAEALALHRRRFGGGDQRTLDGRDEVLALAVEVGLSRRANDVDGLRRLWPRVATALPGRPIDLFLLDPAGELLVAAGRLGEEASEPLASQTELLLDGVGRPAAFAAWPAWHELELAVVAGDPERARSAAGDLERAAEVADLLWSLVAVAYCWRDVLAGHAAPATVASAAREAEAAGFPWEAARLAGGAALRCDESSATQALLALARELQRRLAPMDGQAGGSVLSPREAEIGHLLVQGLTHREIGARLYLSPKTVEHQVAAIRQKLGVATRSELLANLRQQLAPA